MLLIFGRTPSLSAAGTKTYLQAISILQYLKDPWRVRTPLGIDAVVKRNRLGQIKILALAPFTASRLLSETIRDRRWGQKKPKLNKNFWPWRPQLTRGHWRVARHRQRPSEIDAEVKRNHLSQKNSGLNDLNMKRHMFWVVRLEVFDLDNYC